LSRLSISISQFLSNVTVEGAVLGGFDSGPEEWWKDVVLLFSEGCAVKTVEEAAAEAKNVSFEILFQLAILPLLFDRARDCVSVPSEAVGGPLLLSSFRSGLEP
jgi:hypothetical protein